SSRGTRENPRTPCARMRSGRRRGASSVRTRHRAAGCALLRAPAAPLGQALSELRLEPASRWSVVGATLERVGQMLLVHARVRRVVRVLVARPVAEILHEPGG